MNEPMSTLELSQELSAHLDAVTPPPADLETVRRRSRRSRVRRVAVPGLLAAAAVGVGALVLGPSGTTPSDDDPPQHTLIAAADRLDLSDGLRAFASPSERLYLGGTSVALTPDIDYLDTDGLATPYGLLYTDPQGRVHLIGESGRSEELSGPSETPGGWHPTVKGDAERPVVVWATVEGAVVTVTVYDLEEHSTVARTDITCDLGHPGSADSDVKDCSSFVIDAVDSGAVFLRGPSGTRVWDYDTGTWWQLAGPKSRIADARNRVILYDGQEPDGVMKGWRLVPGRIDAQLSYDGSHVLYWSDRLAPTTPDGDPIKLDLPEPATFFTFDTDGSVLAATVDNPSHVYDCELPSGACEQIGEMSTEHGDPMFIGNDM
jgi:hypothetical protein